MLKISMSEMRNHFEKYVHRVKLGEEFLITKYGKPVAEFKPVKPGQNKNRRLTGIKQRTNQE